MKKFIRKRRADDRFPVWAAFGLAAIVVTAFALVEPTLREYLLAAAGSHWLAAMSGIVSLALTFWEKIRSAVGARVFYAIAILAFFFAGYQAWRDEYSKTRPGLKINIAELNVAKENPSLGVPVILIVSVTNIGAPTIADNWLMKIKFVDGREFTDMPTATFGGVSLRGTSIQEPVEYGPEDSIIEKTATPLPTGDKRTGLILFWVPRMTQEQVDRSAKQITIECKDVYGNTLFASAPYRQGVSEPFMVFPGMKPHPARH